MIRARAALMSGVVLLLLAPEAAAQRRERGAATAPGPEAWSLLGSLGYNDARARGLGAYAGIGHRVAGARLLMAFDLTVGSDPSGRYYRRSVEARCRDSVTGNYANDLRCLRFTPALLLDAATAVPGSRLELGGGLRIESGTRPYAGLGVLLRRDRRTPLLGRVHVGAGYFAASVGLRRSM